ncbi:unnamed protein product [Chrysodeixis includens]|uniref:6-phosphogluconate dehydrogenase NADP-binding domain-containing protein n=1 Tax=Chrysodeixis includens TaxID=689277 RepID=A0A9N8KUR4_CHRIL|nr:unnamed protein product [Chrysodeixis includens]
MPEKEILTYVCKDFEKVGATIAVTPCDVVEEADITFSCVADPQAAKEMVFGNCGVLHCPSLESKGYVEMTSIDADTSHDIVEAISGKGGRYLEAQIQGSKTQAEEGTLIILAAGDRSLFDDCQSCFKAMSKNSFYLGDIGNASKMNSVLQVVGGVSLAALAEGLALADRAGLNQADLLDVLALTPLASPHLILKGRGTYCTLPSLSHYGPARRAGAHAARLPASHTQGTRYVLHTALPLTLWTCSTCWRSRRSPPRISYSRDAVRTAHCPPSHTMDLLDVLALTPLASPHLILKGRGTYCTLPSLSHYGPARRAGAHAARLPAHTQGTRYVCPPSHTMDLLDVLALTPLASPHLIKGRGTYCTLPSPLTLWTCSTCWRSRRSPPRISYSRDAVRTAHCPPSHTMDPFSTCWRHVSSRLPHLIPRDAYVLAHRPPFTSMDLLLDVLRAHAARPFASHTQGRGTYRTLPSLSHYGPARRAGAHAARLPASHTQGTRYVLHLPSLSHYGPARRAGAHAARLPASHTQGTRYVLPTALPLTLWTCSTCWRSRRSPPRISYSRDAVRTAHCPPSHTMDLLDVLALTPLASPHLILKGRGTYCTLPSLSHYGPARRWRSHAARLPASHTQGTRVMYSHTALPLTLWDLLDVLALTPLASPASHTQGTRYVLAHCPPSHTMDLLSTLALTPLASPHFILKDAVRTAHRPPLTL